MSADVAQHATSDEIDTRLPSMISATTPLRVVVLSAMLAVLLFGIPWLLTSFWLQITLQAVIYSAVTLGLGLLVGRVGMFSLCQIVFVFTGSWVSIRLAQEWSLPFPVLLVLTGLITGVVGAVIGIPALRLSGLYLALITLMAAGALTLLLRVYKFPNGGSGFWGFDKSKPSGSAALARPSIALGDVAYYRYSVIIVALLFLLVTWHIKGRPGRAWASIRQSQVTAVAAGVDTTLYKLWAFALSACITGVAGALLAAGPGGVTVNQFPVEASIILLAVVLMGGVYSIWGALVAAFLLRILPRLLEQQIGLSTEVLTMLFGVGVIQVLLTAPGGIIADLGRLVDAITRSLLGSRGLTDRRADEREEQFLEVRDRYLRSDNFDLENDDFFRFVSTFYESERSSIDRGLEGMSPNRLDRLLESADAAVSDAGRGANPGLRTIDIRGLRLQLSTAFPADVMEPAGDAVEIDGLILSPAQELELSDEGLQYVQLARDRSGINRVDDESRRQMVAEDVRVLREATAAGRTALYQGDAFGALRATAAATPILERARGAPPAVALVNVVFFPEGMETHLLALKQLAEALEPHRDSPQVGEVVGVALSFAQACNRNLGAVTSSGMVSPEVEHHILATAAELTTTVMNLARSDAILSDQQEEADELNKNVVSYALHRGVVLPAVVRSGYEPDDVL